MMHSMHLLACDISLLYVPCMLLHHSLYIQAESYCLASLPICYANMKPSLVSGMVSMHLTSDLLKDSCMLHLVACTCLHILWYGS